MSTEVYVYHEYQDDQPYMDQVIKLFQSREDGIMYLRERVEEKFGMTFEEVAKRAPETDALATVKEDYVSVQNADVVNFFILEPMKIQEKIKMPEKARRYQEFKKSINQFRAEGREDELGYMKKIVDEKQELCSTFKIHEQLQYYDYFIFDLASFFKLIRGILDEENLGTISYRDLRLFCKELNRAEKMFEEDEPALSDPEEKKQEYESLKEDMKAACKKIFCVYIQTQYCLPKEKAESIYKHASVWQVNDGCYDDECGDYSAVIARTDEFAKA